MAKFVSLHYGGEDILWNFDAVERAFIGHVGGKRNCVTFISTRGTDSTFWFNTDGEAKSWLDEVRKLLE